VKKKRTSFAIFTLLVCFFIVNGCSSQKQLEEGTSFKKYHRASVVKADNFAPGQLEAHYLKHKNEFGNISQDEYLQAARFLLNSEPSEDILEKVRPDGDILRYRISTREFAAMTKEGRIKTYFKADYRYWLRQ